MSRTRWGLAAGCWIAVATIATIQGEVPLYVLWVAVANILALTCLVATS